MHIRLLFDVLFFCQPVFFFQHTCLCLLFIYLLEYFSNLDFTTSGCNELASLCLHFRVSTCNYIIQYGNTKVISNDSKISDSVISLVILVFSLVSRNGNCFLFTNIVMQTSQNYFFSYSTLKRFKISFTIHS